MDGPRNVPELDELKPDERRQGDVLTLVLGQKNYSSWSMRAWLLLKTLRVPFTEVTIPLYRTDSRAAVRALGGQTGLVPVLIDRGRAIWDTLAIFEHLYESHPTVWPADRFARTLARSLSGEIHSSFDALRFAMPVNTRARGRRTKVTPEVAADINRIAEIWSAYRGGPWLFGAFSGADIMFAPVATRFQTYGVELAGAAARSYMDRLLNHPLVAEWLHLGQEEVDVIEELEVGR